jgi:acetyl-CoA carboxylase beta subunit
MDCGMMVVNTNILNLKITAIASDFDFVGGSIGAAEGVLRARVLNPSWISFQIATKIKQTFIMLT